MRVLVISQHRPMFSHTSKESSRRDLLNDMAEHWDILKNNQNTYYPRFGFTSETGTAIPKTGFCFYCNGSRQSLLIILFSFICN